MWLWLITRKGPEKSAVYETLKDQKMLNYVRFQDPAKYGFLFYSGNRNGDIKERRKNTLVIGYT